MMDWMAAARRGWGRRVVRFVEGWGEREREVRRREVRRERWVEMREEPPSRST